MTGSAAFASGPTAIKAVTFDATGTLFHSPRLGEIYAEVLGRHGVSVGAERALGLIHQVWQEFDCASVMERDRFARSIFTRSPPSLSALGLSALGLSRLGPSRRTPPGRTPTCVS